MKSFFPLQSKWMRIKEVAEERVYYLRLRELLFTAKWEVSESLKVNPA